MSKVHKPGVCDCSETPPPEEEAIVLYPSLGTPLLLAVGQIKASIFIAAPSSMRSKAASQELMGEALRMYKLVDQHLRVVSIDDKHEDHESEDSTRTGTLFGEDEDCASAKQFIKAWRVGEFGAGKLIRDRHGRPFATVAPAAATLYPKVQDIYEIELDLSAAPFAEVQAEGSLVSLAWIVRLNAEDRRLPGFKTHAEAQDVAIARFLEKQVAKDPYHFGTLQEFRLRDSDGTFQKSLPEHRSGLSTRLRSWHPVKRMAAKPLKLGHLSDVHVNVRHNVLAASPAKVLEDENDTAWNKPVGSKVCNSFEALKRLFEKMTSGEDKADVVLLTGDLIDFNRNINPKEVSPGRTDTIGEQWKAFNLLGNIYDKNKGPKLYPRGLDDMLVYSLVREMYRQHKLPVIMTSGNHEAYQVPYGISARVEAGDMENWAFKLGVLEATTANHRDGRRTQQANATQSWPDGKLPNEARRAQKIMSQPDQVELHRSKLEAAAVWTRGKANEGMSRDHNMTIYEACLAYGPTYGHALTGSNFSGDQFDWFYALFTPLSDVVLAYGAESSEKTGASAKQVVVALGWGVDENFKNLLGYFKNGVDCQGAGILPRAVESFSDDQLKLVSQAKRYKAASSSSLTVASHFTIVSFDEPEPYSNIRKNTDRLSFVPHDAVTGVAGMKAAYNHVNVGTCEKNQATYLEQHVNVPGRRGSGPAVDWHLSGHSHRSGVYTARWMLDNLRAKATRRLEVVSAKDPGIHGAQTVPVNTTTALIVSSSGGPIGYQNLDGELSAWTGRPPAATLLDPLTGHITQVSTVRCNTQGSFKAKGFNEKPRLCVALDYLQVMSGLPEKGNIEVPLSLQCFKKGFPKELRLSFSKQFAALDCLASVAIWIFRAGKDEAGDSVKGWQRLTPKLVEDRKLGEAALKFNGKDLVKLNQAMNSGVIQRYPNPSKFEKGMEFRRIAQAFIEVGLKSPASSTPPEDWAKDMECTDPWVYPLDICIGTATLSPDSYWTFGRAQGERGEVPDFGWLYEMWGRRPSSANSSYPDPSKVIRPPMIRGH